MEIKEFKKLMKKFDRIIEESNKIIEDCDRIDQELKYQLISMELVDACRQHPHETVERITAEVHKKHNINLRNLRGTRRSSDEYYPIFLEIIQRLNELNECN